MPTEITRLQYNAKNPRMKIEPAGASLSDVVTFDNPAPGAVGKYKIQGNQSFTPDSWAKNISRGYDTLHNKTDFYFKDAASKVPETKALIEASALEGNRVIWDQSNTGGNLRDGYVWKFTTTVPDTTTNEQLKNMKAVMGMLRVVQQGLTMVSTQSQLTL